MNKIISSDDTGRNNYIIVIVTVAEFLVVVIVKIRSYALQFKLLCNLREGLSIRKCVCDGRLVKFG